MINREISEIWMVSISLMVFVWAVPCGHQSLIVFVTGTLHVVMKILAKFLIAKEVRTLEVMMGEVRRSRTLVLKCNSLRHYACATLDLLFINAFEHQ